MMNDLLRRARQRWPTATAVDSVTGSMSYAALEARACALAAGLAARGVGTGDRVLLAASNSPDAVAAMHAIWRIGAVLSWIHPSTPERKRERLAARLAARAVLIDTDLPGLAHAGDTGYAQRSADDLAAILFTSGSEGEPKGVMLQHGAMRAALDAIQSYLGYRSDDVVGTALPLSFDYGLYQLLLAANVGASASLLPELALLGKAESALRAATVLPLMPSIVALLRAANVRAWPGLRLITSTGAALAPAQIDWLLTHFPNATLYSMYGLTECKRISYLPPEWLARKPGSIGVAIPGTRVDIVDEGGASCPAGAIGELIVKGPTLMAGYWNDPPATARALRLQGGERALFTGDRAYRDGDGHLYFVGRSDDIIKSRGMKVAPKEVEAALLEIDGVIAAAVIGIDDAMQGQAIAAYVELAPGASLPVAVLRRQCAARLEAPLVPKYLHIVAALPRTPNGKIDKAALR